MEVFLGSIWACPYTRVPYGYAFCAGQLLPISTATALFSLLGTQYGGDGKSNFALPNLQGNTPIGFGSGAGLSSYVVGEQGGQPNVTLVYNQMPMHNHAVSSVGSAGSNTNPSNQVFAKDGDNKNAYSSAGQQNLAMNQNMLQYSGGNQAHDNMMPFLGLNWIIAMQGIFPARQ